MELTGKKYGSGGGGLRKLLSTRHGTALVAGACTLVAAGVLIFAASRYRHSVDVSTQPETVFVASTLIQKGTPGDVISKGDMFRSRRIVAKQVSAGAIANTALIHGKVAATDIQPGQQLTASDFTAGDGLASQLAPDERAMSIALDTSHGLNGVVHAGDRVDVYAGITASVDHGSGGAGAGAALRLLISNVPVLSVNQNSGGGVGASSVNNESDVVLKVKANAAGALAFAADNGKVWLVLRGANATEPKSQAQAVYTINSLLLGSQVGGDWRWTMKSVVKALVVLDSRVDRQVVETLLTSSPAVDVLDYIELDDGGVAPDGADILVVACEEFSEQVAQYVAQASEHRPQRPVVVLAPASTNGYVADAFGHGADDIVTLPGSDDLSSAAEMAPGVVFSLEKAVARKRGAKVVVERGLGEMICVLGLKGGSGKTLTTANLAVALADLGKKVAVVDLDLQFGDIGLALGVSPERTLYDLARSGGSLDTEKVTDFMAVHSSGVHALLAPTRPDQAGLITSEFVRDVLRVLREMSDFVIVDTPPGFTPEVITAVDDCTAVCMVAMLDSLSLKNTKLGFETLALMDYPDDKVRLVLNRADSKVGIAAEDVVAIMGRAPSILVPSDRNVTRSINEGEPITVSSRRSDAARAFHALAALYASADKTTSPPTASKPRRRLFARS